MRCKPALAAVLVSGSELAWLVEEYLVVFVLTAMLVTKGRVEGNPRVQH
jgi:hypothetical protein